ncbi:sulfur carrier protein ThiS [Pelagibacterales bacterium SAG-MED39]|nr:sulfur carrier protein ThiS [Pelagibacterales bacterium SAG-MED39]
MKKIKKIKIKVNGKVNIINKGIKLSNLIKRLKIPIKKVAIELNQEIIEKKNIDRVVLKKNDQIEIVHFIGGG